ncbi:MAG: helix-turn-helix domain-containing protein [Steroidobacteraceae bacterium]
MSNGHKPPRHADESSSSPSTHADRLRAALQRAGLSQRAAARLLEVDERAMRQWCAGQGAPPESIYRALSPKSAHLEDLRRRIEQNEQVIDAFEKGHYTIVPRAYQPTSEKAAKQEIVHLRKCNEEHRAFIRMEEAIEWKREAHAAVFAQWLPHGSGVPTEDSLDRLDAAEHEFQAAKVDVDRITQEIRAGRR